MGAKMWPAVGVMLPLAAIVVCTKHDLSTIAAKGVSSMTQQCLKTVVRSFKRRSVSSPGEACTKLRYLDLK